MHHSTIVDFVMSAKCIYSSEVTQVTSVRTLRRDWRPHLLSCQFSFSWDSQFSFTCSASDTKKMKILKAQTPNCIQWYLRHICTQVHARKSSILLHQQKKRTFSDTFPLHGTIKHYQVSTGFPVEWQAHPSYSEHISGCGSITTSNRLDRRNTLLAVLPSVTVS